MKSSTHIPELDGIRGTAIAMVLFWHLFVVSGAAMPAAGSFFSRALIPVRIMWTGVDLFFVLSGFLIGGILLDARGSSNYFQMFYTRRFFRIVPLYVAVLLGVQALIFASRFFPVEGSGWVVGNAAPWYSFWTFTQNFFMARANTPGPHISSVTWSLAVEEQFYLTLPLVIRFVSGRRLLIVVVAGIILAPILRTAILLVSPGSWVAPFVLMPCRMDALLLGVLAAILFRSEKVWERFQRSGRYFALLFVVLLCGVAFLMLRSAMMYDLLMQKIGYTWMAFFYATLLVFVLSHRQSFLSGIFRNATLRWLGMLAYCTYLIHQAVQGAVFAAIWHRQPGITDVYTLLTMIACLAATLGIANLSWRYFERPLIGLGHGTEYRDEGTQVSRIG